MVIRFFSPLALLKEIFSCFLELSLVLGWSSYYLIKIIFILWHPKCMENGINCKNSTDLQLSSLVFTTLVVSAAATVLVLLYLFNTILSVIFISSSHFIQINSDRFLNDLKFCFYHQNQFKHSSMLLFNCSCHVVKLKYKIL